MKQKFIDMLSKLCKPWVAGSAGTPWSFSSLNLLEIGDRSLMPEIVVDKDGEVKPVYLSLADVNEAMEELGFKSNFYTGPGTDFGLSWEVELMPTVTL